MTTQQPGIDDLLPLSPVVLHILLALSDGTKHGYAIMKEVEADTAGHVKLGPGTLYGALKRMLERGLIAESGERVDPDVSDERRRYYEITGFGQRLTRAEILRLQALTERARAKAVLEGT